VATLAIYGFVLGSILGLRYRVFVLVPTILTGAAIIIGVAVVQGADVMRSALAIIVLNLLVQTGYICSALIRHVVMRSDWGAHPSPLAALSPGDRKMRAH